MNKKRQRERNEHKKETGNNDRWKEEEGDEGDAAYQREKWQQSLMEKGETKNDRRYLVLITLPRTAAKPPH